MNVTEKQSVQYNPAVIEPKWQQYWESNATFKATEDADKEKYYALVMFPYPSAEGLHVGHPLSYTAMDITARYQRALGKSVLYSMGWDAFGLPAEQHALKTGTPPQQNTDANVANFRSQLDKIGFALDWSREINSTDPNYYKWTQWIFLQLFKRGLAYVDQKPVWWCPALGTVLANEEVIDGKSERGNHPVERRNLRQWVLKITAYADRLLEGLETLDWPESTKQMQRTWIGRSRGAEVHFPLVDNKQQAIVAYTTRHDTLFGCTYLVLAPEHPLVAEITTDENKSVVDAYVKEAAGKSDLRRTELNKDKTGVFTGAYVINPINDEKIPVWVADYVLVSYGTGAVLAVPSHDKRDAEFSEKFGLPFQPVLAKTQENPEEHAGLNEGGYLINSGAFDGMFWKDAKEAIVKALEAKQLGKGTVNFKLRDWLFSRQRYWGEPFPILWVDEETYHAVQAQQGSPWANNLPENPVAYQNAEGKTVYGLPIPEAALPVKLPEIEDYQPSGTGESPLANAQEWVQCALNIETGEVVPAKAQAVDGKTWFAGQRETNTMPQWAGSCWYYLRYLDPQNAEKIFDPAKEAYWGAPDLYIGGAEHAVLHFLYARFWHQALYDAGMVKTPEPFPKIFHQGMILGEAEHHTFTNEEGEYVSAELVEAGKDSRSGEALSVHSVQEDAITKLGEWFVLKDNPKVKLFTKMHKMSKSRGNVINPDEVIQAYGADTLRLFEMFMGPLDQMKPWSRTGIGGMNRFLRKVWREFISESGEVTAKMTDEPEVEETLKALHETIAKVTDDVEALRFNTAISQLMILLNHLTKAKRYHRETVEAYLTMLNPLAPHIAEELWERLGHSESISKASWPTLNPELLQTSTVKVMVQVNGKLRGDIHIDPELAKDAVFALAKEQAKVQAALEGKSLVKEIYVPGKIVNLVVK